MKKVVIFFIFLISKQITQASVANPDSLIANNGGVLIPQMTTDQKLAIPNPKEGLLVYDTDAKQFSYCLSLPLSGSLNCNWVNFGNSGSIPTTAIQKIAPQSTKEAFTNGANILNTIIAELNAELSFMAADCEKKSADGGIYDDKKRKETYRYALAEFQKLAENGPTEKIRQRAAQKIEELKQKIAQKGD